LNDVAGKRQNDVTVLKALFYKRQRNLVFVCCVAKMKNSHVCFFYPRALKSYASQVAIGIDPALIEPRRSSGTTDRGKAS